MASLGFIHVFEPGADFAAPPLLLLHGTGGDEHNLIPLGRALSPGSALLSPRGRVSEHGAARFFARLTEGVFDPAEVTGRAHELADFLAAAAAHYGFDPARLTAIGISNGANIAAALLQVCPDALGGAALYRPMVVLDQPAAPGSLTGKRVLITSGARDSLVPAEHPHRLAAHLGAGGATIDLRVLPNGHGLTRDDVLATQEWLRAGA